MTHMQYRKNYPESLVIEIKCPLTYVNKLIWHLLCYVPNGHEEVDQCGSFSIPSEMPCKLSCEFGESK